MDLRQIVHGSVKHDHDRLGHANRFPGSRSLWHTGIVTLPSPHSVFINLFCLVFATVAIVSSNSVDASEPGARSASRSATIVLNAPDILRTVRVNVRPAGGSEALLSAEVNPRPDARPADASADADGAGISGALVALVFGMFGLLVISRRKMK